MLKTNDREWKEFFIKDIFITKETYRGIQMPTGAHIEKEKLYNGKIPRITVTSRNNGVDSFCYTEDRNKREYSNFISVSFLGSAFYQKGSATLDMKVHALIPKDIDLNQYIALFIIVALLNNIKNSTYGNQLSSTDLPRRKILLPVNKEGKPDYKFMEQFIKEREEIKRQEYINYCQERICAGGGYFDSKKLIPSISLNDREWKEFQLSELFVVELSRGDNQSSLLQKGNYPLISAGANNNGICAFIEDGDGRSQLFNANAITVDMFGKPFYQPYMFFSVSHGRINILKFKGENFNKYIGLFIAMTVNEGVKNKYSYNQMCSQKRLLRQPIMLPVESESKPDYKFMENYIKEREFIKMQEYLDYCNQK